MRAPARGPAVACALALLGLVAACEAEPSSGAAGAAGAAAESAPADTAPAEAAYVRYAQLGSGGDTLRVERVLRGPGRLGARIDRPAGGVELSLDGVIDGDGRFRSLTVERMTGEDAGRRTFHFGETSVRVERAAGDSIVASEIPVPRGTMPFVPASVALLEQVLQRARRSDPPATEVTILDLASGDDQVGTLTIEWLRPDSALARMDGRVIEVLLDESGRVASTLGSSSGTRHQRLP